MKSKGNLVVFCCQCARHFKRDDVFKMKIEHVKSDFYICKHCLDNIPKLNEHIIKPLKKIKE